MPDTVDAATRSRMMSAVRGRDTKIEIAVRKALFSLGLRYRTNVRSLPGSPDIVLSRWRAAVFVHGCFWHAHDCGLCRIPGTREEFWREKLETNAARDKRNQKALLDAGWRVATVWECAIRRKEPRVLLEVADQLATWIRGNETVMEVRG